VNGQLLRKPWVAFFASKWVSVMKFSTQTSAALAALGLVGTAGSAHAGLVTETYDILPSIYPDGSHASVAVDSTSPQFFYNGVKTGIGTGHYEFGSTTGGLIASTGVDGVGSVQPSLSYSPQSLDMAHVLTIFTSFNGTGYVNLEFTNGAGKTEFGYATFDTARGPDRGELETITYQSAVPEPSTWALLIAGAGVLGLATRRRRRAALAAA
jgi:PEP-CTERM motif